MYEEYNKKILKSEKETFGCNCRTKNDCPLSGECLTPKIVYEACITNNSNNEIKTYIGLTERAFKERFNNHTKDCKHIKYKNNTELAKYIWSLKENGITPRITWRILSKVHGEPRNKCCKLCLMEKYFIISQIDNNNLLNKRSEFITKCRHINKFLLNNVKKKR